MKSIIATLILCASAVSLAEVQTAPSTASKFELADSIVQKDGFIAQLDMQFFSLAGNGSPMMGPCLAYQIFDDSYIGLRTLLSLTKTGESSAYSGQVFWRQDLSHKPTRLFWEPSVAVNRAEFQNFISGGVALGVLHRYDNEIAFGASTGMELSGLTSRGSVASISMGANSDSGTEIGIAPKVTFFGNYSF